MRTVARRATLADYLSPVIATRRLSAWCAKAGLRTQTVTYLLDGLAKPQRGTVSRLAIALGITEDGVREACAASREAATERAGS